MSTGEGENIANHTQFYFYFANRRFQQLEHVTERLQMSNIFIALRLVTRHKLMRKVFFVMLFLIAFVGRYGTFGDFLYSGQLFIFQLKV